MNTAPPHPTQPTEPTEPAGPAQPAPPAESAESAVSGVRIRAARAADVDTYTSLVALIDLHQSDVGKALEPMRMALAEEPAGPLSHRFNHFLIAETDEGTPVGVVCCGTPLWVYEHPVPPFMQAMIRRRISCMHALAVHPDHRGHGIGRALARQAEHDLTEAGLSVLTLRHEPGPLEDYYRRLGYTSADRLAMDLPPLGVVTKRVRPWKFAVKPLSPAVSFTTVYGHPVRVVTGALASPPGTHNSHQPRTPA